MRNHVALLSVAFILALSAPPLRAQNDPSERIGAIESTLEQFNSRLNDLESAIRTLQRDQAQRPNPIRLKMDWVAKQTVLGSCSTATARQQAFDTACRAKNFKYARGGECIPHSRGRVIVSVLCSDN